MIDPGTKINRRVAVVGCKHTTLDLILGLARHGFATDHCVTISPEIGQKEKVAGYYDLRDFLRQKGIRFTVVNTYNLKSIEDRDVLLSLKLDMLLVMGWQRLLPDWWLQSLSIGAFGMHGSSKPLPHGRGRSPMNWSLIQGKSVFYTHLFNYRPGVDDGPIVGVQLFDITQFDSCYTLHLKNTVAMVKLCVRYMPDLLAGEAHLVAQPSEGASYYPKRTAEDGLIHWDDATLEIYNLVRAVTKPFPGAFTYLRDDPQTKVMIWRAIPFDTKMQWPLAEPGQILEVFFDGSFVVKTGDASILIQECEGHTFEPGDIGLRLGHLGVPKKVWNDLPE